MYLDIIIMVMHMNKIHRSKFSSYFSIFIIVFQFVFSVINIKLIIDMIKENNNLGTIIFIVEFIIFTTFFIFSYFYLNRIGAIIIYDDKKNILIRKGYFFGYKSTIKVDDIIKIKKVTLPKDNSYYVLIDNKHYKYEGGSKNSYFSITCSKESKEFIEQFWKEPLEKFYD